MSRQDQEPQQPKGGWEEPYDTVRREEGGYGIPADVLKTFIDTGEAAWQTNRGYFTLEEGDITQVGDQDLIEKDAIKGGVDYKMYKARINLVTNRPEGGIQVHLVRIQ